VPNKLEGGKCQYYLTYEPGIKLGKKYIATKEEKAWHFCHAFKSQFAKM
jgi:hypothetical protein